MPLWREITSDVPNNADYATYFGVALRDAGQRAEAMDAFRYAIVLDPIADRPHIELARTFLRQGLADSALHHLESLPLVVRDRSAEILWVMAELLYAAERFSDAHAAVQRAIELDPDNADAHDLAARVLVRMPQTRENREQAARHAKKAAGGGRRGGLAEWQATKRLRRA
ncbi:MAG: tetratricopeptide repeat protein [Phycisphaerales bacterium]